MEFIKPAQASALLTIKSEVATALEGAGMPKKIYVILSDKPIEGYDSIDGVPTPSAKDGRIMYNFGGRFTLKSVVGRLQGNFFLPKDGWTVDPATLKAYQGAKVEWDAKRTANAKK